MIVVFGSINLDLVTSVARIAGPGETVLGPHYATSPGGKGANQALAARRAGAEVRLVGAVGRDGFAEEALALLRAEGVDLSGVAQSDLPTGAAFISVDAQGRNAITVAAGANAKADPSRLGQLGERDLLLLQREIPDAACEEAARMAKAGGARVVLNLAPSGSIPKSYLALVDILIANEEEARDAARSFAVDQDDLTALARLLMEHHGIALIVTRGGEGVEGWNGGEHRCQEARQVEVVDTTGAGDSFVGAFAAALAEGEDFADALRRGAVAGSLACTKHGAQPSIPTRAEVDATAQPTA